MAEITEAETQIILEDMYCTEGGALTLTKCVNGDYYVVCYCCGAIADEYPKASLAVKAFKIREFHKNVSTLTEITIISNSDNGSYL